MGTVVELNPRARREVPDAERPGRTVGEVVIFPGVRIERHDIDLSRRVLDTTGSDDFGGGRPRKTS